MRNEIVQEYTFSKSPGYDHLPMTFKLPDVRSRLFFICCLFCSLRDFDVHLSSFLLYLAWMALNEPKLDQYINLRQSNNPLRLGMNKNVQTPCLSMQLKSYEPNLEDYCIIPPCQLKWVPLLHHWSKMRWWY